MKPYHLLPVIAVAVAAASCSPLSPEAREIVGRYYIDEVSDDTPLLELNDDGTSVMRAIRADVLTVTVPGTWNVENDSLIIVNDIASLKAIGDTSIMGYVAPRSAHHIIERTPVSITLDINGLPYQYHRR
ncbi:MAG: hypothetical protein NC117_00945 [Pseudoflavonifractor sp.]|nr:hypothetical protein [Pseudoflavonifractor sp.]